MTPKPRSSTFRRYLGSTTTTTTRARPTRHRFDSFSIRVPAPAPAAQGLIVMRMQLPILGRRRTSTRGRGGHLGIHRPIQLSASMFVVRTKRLDARPSKYLPCGHEEEWEVGRRQGRRSSYEARARPDSPDENGAPGGQYPLQKQSSWTDKVGGGCGRGEGRDRKSVV